MVEQNASFQLLNQIGPQQSKGSTSISSTGNKGIRKDGIDLPDIKQQYLLPHFQMLLIGKPGSGKTHMIKRLLTEPDLYNKAFDIILLVSPSAQKMGLDVPAEQMTTTFSLTWIYSWMNKANAFQKKRMIELLKANSSLAKHFLPAEVLSKYTLNAEMKERDVIPALPHEYKAWNKEQRFFSAEILASATGGGKTMFPREKKKGQPVPDRSGGKGKRVNKLKAMVANSGGDPSTCDPNIIEKDLVSQLTPAQRDLTRLNLLLILDDVVGDIKALETDPALASLFFNRRHLIANGTTSIIVVSQKFTMIPARIRSNANWLILFRLNPLDFDSVYKDVVMMPLPQWRALLDYIYSANEMAIENKDKKFDNLGIWVEFDRYFKDFHPIAASAPVDGKWNKKISQQKEQIPMILEEQEEEKV